MKLTLDSAILFNWSEKSVPLTPTFRKPIPKLFHINFLTPFPFKKVLCHPGPSPTLLHPTKIFFEPWTLADRGIEFGWKLFLHKQNNWCNLFLIGQSRFPPRSITKEILFDQTLLSLYMIYSRLPKTLSINPKFLNQADLGITLTLFWKNTVFPFWSTENDFFHHSIKRPSLTEEYLLWPLSQDEIEKSILEIEQKPILPFYTLDSNKSLTSLSISFPLSS